MWPKFELYLNNIRQKCGIQVTQPKGLLCGLAFYEPLINLWSTIWKTVDKHMSKMWQKFDQHMTSDQHLTKIWPTWMAVLWPGTLWKTLACLSPEVTRYLPVLSNSTYTIQMYRVFIEYCVFPWIVLNSARSDGDRSTIWRRSGVGTLSPRI